jgi:hypothetical protein
MYVRFALCKRDDAREREIRGREESRHEFLLRFGAINLDSSRHAIVISPRENFPETFAAPVRFLQLDYRLQSSSLSRARDLIHFRAHNVSRTDATRMDARSLARINRVSRDLCEVLHCQVIRHASRLD